MRVASTIPIAFAVAFAQPAGAQPLPGSAVQPVDISSTYRVSSGPNSGIGQIVFTIDQSGLGNTYVSGETDFDTFVASTAHSNSNAASTTLFNPSGVDSPSLVLGGTITIDLGDEIAIDGVGFWTTRDGGKVMSPVAIHADDDDDFSNGGTTLVAAVDLARGQGGQARRFDAVTTRFVHFEVVGHGGDNNLRHSEFVVRAADAVNDCPADTNGDGELTPGDFNGWVIAFNNQTDACDQNGDGACTPGDFNSWILNFNAGCD